MENNSQPSAPAAAAKVTPPAKETTQASSNHEVMPMAARTTATAGFAGQPQRGTAIGSVQQHPQPLSRSMQQALAVAGTGTGTGTGSVFGTTAQCGASATMLPRLRPLACKPVQQTTPVVFGQGSSSSNQAMQQGSSSTQAVAATALAAATHRPSAQHGATVPLLSPPAALRAVPIRAVRPTKRMITRPSSPPPPKLPVYYRHPPPPRPELASSSATGNALLQSPSDTGFPVSNMQANPPPSPGHVASSAEEASNSEGGGGRGGDVKMLDLNFPPDSDDEN